ncbi:MAG: hypothetical protein PVI30_24505 [Myxococcales bacterium]|jgi:hypothetical protein
MVAWASSAAAQASEYPYSPHASGPEDFHPAERSGPFVSVGIGTQHAGFGTHAGWYQVPPEAGFTWAPYAGLGALPGYESLPVLPGVVLGVMAQWGHVDRWVIDANFGRIGIQGISLAGVAIGQRNVYGLGLSAGREWDFPSGVLLRALVGVALPADPVYRAIDDAQFTLGLAVGYRL